MDATVATRSAQRESEPTARRNRDAEVVAAAIKVFYEKGYAATSIQDVADVVGVLKGSLYHYINSKEDLLFRILEESHRQARVIMDEVAAEQVEPLQKLRIYLERMYEWYLTHIERVSLYFNQQRYLTGNNKSFMREREREFHAFLRGLVVDAQDEGSLRPDLDVTLAVFFILGALNSIPMWYRGDGSYSKRRISTEFAKMSLNSLGNES
jgi:TetR/AcrR family transcriptional regulator, cholesterol catabolism regulator